MKLMAQLNLNKKLFVRNHCLDQLSNLHAINGEKLLITMIFKQFYYTIYNEWE